jgi:hypothetical protein
MEQVGHVVVERRFAVTVALCPAQLERLRGRGKRCLDLARRATSQRQVIKRRHATGLVIGQLGHGQAPLVVLPAQLRLAAVIGQNAERVVRPNQSMGIVGLTRQLERPSRQVGSPLVITTSTGDQTPIRIQDRPFGGRGPASFRLAIELRFGREQVPIGAIPFASANVEVGQLVFDSGEIGLVAEGGGELVAIAASMYRPASVCRSAIASWSAAVAG